VVATAVRIGVRALPGVLVGVLSSLLAAGGAQASETVTQRFTATGSEQTFVVPPGNTTIAVRAVGGTGRGGGAPAEVTGEIGVTPGETLYVEVGGSPTGQSGGFNGGGQGGDPAAGGGGGASDVRTVTSADPEGTLASRLIVAGASGGASSTGNGGGAAGAEGLPVLEGGKPGTQTAGGESEELWECWIEKEHEGKHEGGTPGQLGTGGDGEGCHSHSHGGDGGGGGGAGLYGGGGGGVEFDVEPPYEFASGGGGGSSLVPEGGTLALAEGVAPQIELTYTPSAPAVTTGAASAVGVATATLNATVNPEGSAVSSCEFEYGTSTFYEATVPCSTSPGAGEEPVAVSAAIEGLSASTTYHYRVLATNGGGTTSGLDAEFTTPPQHPPTVTKVAPKKGSTAGGTAVVITGSGLDTATEVRFGSVPGTIVSKSPGTLRVTSPPDAAGKYGVTVVGSGGSSASSSRAVFTFKGVTVASVSPSTGPLAGGTPVTVGGSGFAPGAGATKFMFGKHPASAVECSSSQDCTMTSPAGAGSGAVDVRAVVGAAKSKKSVADRFSYE
jgi:hypothetical protein